MVDKRSEHKPHTHHNHRQDDLYQEEPTLQEKQHSHPDLNKQDHDKKEEIIPQPQHKMH